MLVRWFMQLFLGYVVLRVQGSGAENFLNQALSRGIVFWDVCFREGGILVKTYPDNFPLLRPIGRRTGCSLRIHGKYGLPFLFYRFKRRRGLVTGLLVFFLILYTAGRFVWFVEVEGLEEVEAEEILRAAEELGLHPGAYKRSLDFASLEREFLLKREDLAWVGFQLQGTRLIIEIMEKDPPLPDFRDTTSDLLASKDGVVEKVLVLSGEARVSPGDTVQKGQVLIVGVLTVEREEGEETVRMETGTVRARGEVWARVWYEFKVTRPLWEEIQERTGNSTTAYHVRILDRAGRFGPEASPYRNYQVEKIKANLTWRNMAAPIELITVHYHQLRLHRKELTRDEALYKGREELYSLARASVPSQAEISSVNVEELPSPREEMVSLRLVVETRENIVKEREHEEKEDTSD